MIRTQSALLIGDNTVAIHFAEMNHRRPAGKAPDRFFIQAHNDLSNARATKSGGHEHISGNCVISTTANIDLSGHSKTASHCSRLVQATRVGKQGVSFSAWNFPRQRSETK